MKPFYSEEDAAARYGVSKRMLARLREEGTGPAYIRIGRRRIVYGAEALAEWAEANTHPSRAAELAKEMAGDGK